MNLKLNIYREDNPREIEKTYETDTYDLMFGTIEDLANAVDLDKVQAQTEGDKYELGKMILKLMPQIKPLLRSIFGGVTDDEIRRTKVKELVPMFITAFKFAFDEMNGLGDGKSGNAGN